VACELKFWGRVLSGTLVPGKRRNAYFLNGLMEGTDTTPRRKQALQTRVRMNATSSVPSSMDSHQRVSAQKASDPVKQPWRPPLASLAVNAPVHDYPRELKKRAAVSVAAVNSPTAVRTRAIDGVPECAPCSTADASPATLLCGCALQ
jgi:hypothetical protein